jgi:hypothetical protein
MRPRRSRISTLSAMGKGRERIGRGKQDRGRSATRDGGLPPGLPILRLELRLVVPGCCSHSSDADCRVCKAAFSRSSTDRAARSEVGIRRLGSHAPCHRPGHAYSGKPDVQGGRGPGKRGLGSHSAFSRFSMSCVQWTPCRLDQPHFWKCCTWQDPSCARDDQCALIGKVWAAPFFFGQVYYWLSAATHKGGGVGVPNFHVTHRRSDPRLPSRAASHAVHRRLYPSTVGAR